MKLLIWFKIYCYILVNRPDNSLNRTAKVVTNKSGRSTTYRRSDQNSESNCCHFETIPANTKYSEVVIDLTDTKTYPNNIKTTTSLISKCLPSANESTISLTLSPSSSTTITTSSSSSNNPVTEKKTLPTITSSTASALKQLRHHSKTSFHPNFPHRHHHHHHLLKTSPTGANSANNVLTASNLDQGVIC